MVQACHTPQQPLQNHPLGHLGGWAMLWLAEEMLDGQHQRVDIPTNAKTAHKGLLQKNLEEDLCWIIPPVPLMTQLVKELIDPYFTFQNCTEVYSPSVCNTRILECESLSSHSCNLFQLILISNFSIQRLAAIEASAITLFQIFASVQRIKQSLTRGEDCLSCVKLKVIPRPSDGDQCLERPGLYTPDDSGNLSSLLLHPPASADETEFQILKFHDFTSNLEFSVLKV